MQEHDLPLGDRLGLDLTALANRRTWLASVRTALALFVTGASFLQFFDFTWSLYMGGGFIALSAPVLLAGLVRYRVQCRELKALAAARRPRKAR